MGSLKGIALHVVSYRPFDAKRNLSNCTSFYVEQTQLGQVQQDKREFSERGKGRGGGEVI